MTSQAADCRDGICVTGALLADNPSTLPMKVLTPSIRVPIGQSAVLCRERPHQGSFEPHEVRTRDVRIHDSSARSP